MMSDTDILTPQHRASEYICSYVHIKYIEKYMNKTVDNNVGRIINRIDWRPRFYDSCCGWGAVDMPTFDSEATRVLRAGVLRFIY